MIKKVTISLLAAMALSWAPAVYAQNVTEFGVEGDLTVLGKNAVSATDPDVEIKGFSVFGATQAAPALVIPFAPGNIFVNGYVQVSSGMYVTGSSTFTSGAYFTGVSSFTSGPSSMYINGGLNGQVMSYNSATGAMQWTNPAALGAGDNLGNHIAEEMLNMMTFDVYNAGYITASSEALTGQLIVYGTTTLTGNVSAANNLSAGYITASSETLTGQMVVGSSLTVNGNTVLGDTPGTDYVGINGVGDATTALKVVGEDLANKYSAKFYSGTNLAAWIKKK